MAITMTERGHTPPLSQGPAPKVMWRGGRGGWCGGGCGLEGESEVVACGGKPRTSRFPDTPTDIPTKRCAACQTGKGPTTKKRKAGPRPPRSRAPTARRTQPPHTNAPSKKFAGPSAHRRVRPGLCTGTERARASSPVSASVYVHFVPFQLVLSSL